MALEITMNASFKYDDGVTAIIHEVVDRMRTSADAKVSAIVQYIETTETPLNFGDVDNPGALFIKNLDPVNSVDILAAAAGAIVATLGPDLEENGKGGFISLDQVGAGMLTPVAIASLEICRVLVVVGSL